MAINISLNGKLEAKLNKAFLAAKNKKITSNKDDFIKTGIDTYLDMLSKNKVI